MTPTVAETAYGVAKRLRVFHAWLDQQARDLGKPALDVLDYGCGTGEHVSAPLAAAGHRVVGVDIHEQSINEARARYRLPTMEFRTADLQDLLHDPARFDAVICSEVIEHVHQPAVLLSGLTKLLHPRGVLLVSTPNGYGAFETLTRIQRVFGAVGLHQAMRWTFWSVRNALRRIRRAAPLSRPFEDLGGAKPGFLNENSPHVQFFTVRQLNEVFAQAGLRVVERRARTFVCGPYADALMQIAPLRATLFELNSRAADAMPFAMAAGWMFLLAPLAAAPSTR